MTLSVILALTASTAVGLFAWRMAQRREQRELWGQVGSRLQLRLVSHGRGAVYELIGDVRGAPVAARLIPESTRTPVTIFVGRRALARRTGELLASPGDTMVVFQGAFEGQVDELGLVAELSATPVDVSAGVRAIQTAVDLYLNHYRDV